MATRLSKNFDVTAISTKPNLVSGQELGNRLTNPENWKRYYLPKFSDFKKLDNVSIIHGKAAQLKPYLKTIFVETTNGDRQELSYDALVIASGTRNGFWRNSDIKNIDRIEQDLTDQASLIERAQKIAIVGGGPTAVSSAAQIKEFYPDKQVSLFFPSEQVLKGYHPDTRAYITQRLSDDRIDLNPKHRARLPDTFPILTPGTIEFETGQRGYKADCILWAVGNIQPNNEFIPADMLDELGFVQVAPTFQTPDHPSIFAIGDIAASDPNRSSARNAGFVIAAINIKHYLKGNPQRMRAFKAPENRWGSVMGIRREGLRVFSPKGKNTKISPSATRNIIWPVFVDRLIYKGIRRQ